jgi:uncharacterized protein (TIGR03437 family)
MIRFFFSFIGCAALAGAASISGIYNAGSWVPPSLPNSGIARGAIFTVTGTGLGPAALQQVQSYPLPMTLAGTTIQVHMATVAESCIMIYTSATQVAAILPSATPLGNGTLTISYQGATASLAIEVVAGDFGMFTLNEGGSGPAVVTDLSYSPITMVNPAHPGENLILWGTGLGAVSGDETQPPAAVNFPGVQVLIGDQLVTPGYAGRSSSPGLDQVNVTVPAGISGGCKTTLAVVVNGVTGNAVSTSVAPAGQATCGDTYGALTAGNLQTAIANGSLNIGVVDLSRVGTNDDALAASFANYPVNSLIRSYAGSFAPSLGNCVAYELVAGGTFFLSDPILPTLPHLDAGPALVITPANGTAMTVDATSTGLYAAALGTAGNVYIAPGAYSVANANGGSQVSAFNWSDTLPAPVGFVNLPSVINRSQSLTVNWSGSAPYSLVTIFGYAGVPLSSTENAYIEFVCAAPATSTQFKIPAAIVSLIPTNGYGAFGVPGVGMQIAGVVDNRFTVTGLDAGVFTTFTSTGAVVKVQ